MDIDITIKNYRCFSDDNPVRLSFGRDFTAFVGPNNSGKSSLLRFFYEFRELFRQLQPSSSELREALRGRRRGLQYQGVPDPEGAFCNRNARDLTVQLDFHEAPAPQGSTPAPERIIFTFQRPNTWVATIRVSGQNPLLGINPNTIDINDRTLTGGGGDRADLTPVFRVGQALADTVYIGAFRNILNVGVNQNYFDIQVGQAFVELWRGYKSGPTIRHNLAALEVEQDIRRIFEYESIQINPSADNQTLQVVVDGQPYMLPALGSGLAQFILVLANAAIRRPAYILIDEPELNLHASLQLDFLTSLGSYAREGVLFSTHSIGLARAGADRIYSLRKESDGSRLVAMLEGNPRLSEFAGELNFSGYRELGFDRLLLVEGPTEVKTVQQFLRKYRKDHEVVLLPLGGGSMINGARETELREIQRISDQVSVLIDSERAGPGSPLDDNRAAFVETCKRLSIPCHVLERRAIENYFPDRAVQAALGDPHRALEAYEKVNEVPHGWRKSEGWRIAQAMTLAEVDATELGEFFRSL